MHYVYVLLSQKDRKFYIGLTEDIKQRVSAHNGGNVESTRFRRPWELIYYEFYLEKSDAIGREGFLKSGSGHRYIEKQLKNYLVKYRGVEQLRTPSPS